MKTHLLRLFFIYSLFSISKTLHAQELFSERYNASYVTMNDGLQSNFIDNVAKDSRGFLWISTAGGGLFRYDGYECVPYTTNTLHCKLKSNFIRKVCEDAFNRLWVVSEGGIDIIDLNTLRSVIPRGKSSEISQLVKQPSSNIIGDSKQCLWIYGNSTLSRISFTTEGEIAHVASRTSMTISGSEMAMSDVDNDGAIWTGIANRISKINITTKGALNEADLASCLTFSNEVSVSAIQRKENEVWIATNWGLFRYDKNKNAIRQYLHNPKDARSLTQNYLTDLALTSDKQLLVATLKGVNVYYPLTDDFDHLTSYETTSGTRLNSNFINCLYIDDNRIWIGTETGGLNKLAPQRLSLKNYIHNKDNPNSLSANPVNAVYEDKRGSLWVGTVEGGLNHKEPDSEHFTHYTKEQSGLSHNSVSALTADKENRLWVGTWGGGINLISLNPPHRILKHISLATTKEFPIDFVGTLIYDSINNGMWIGSNQGIYFYDTATNQISEPFANGVSRNIHGCIGSIIDRQGNLWIGCMEGVYVINLHSRKKNKFSYRQLNHKLDKPNSGLIEKITCFYEATDGTLWLGSNGYGMYKRSVDAQGKERFIAYTTTQGLPNNSIRGIAGGANETIWVATNNGLSCYTPSDSHFTNYNAEDGMINAQFYWNASCKPHSDVIYFGSLNGLTAIETNRKSLSPRPTTVRLTRLRIGNEEVLPGFEFLKEDISICSVLNLHESDKSFSIEFSALNFDLRSTGIYSYRLVGFDDSWTHVPSTRRFAGYTNLPSGHYTLEVKYAPDGEVGNEIVTQLPIVIAPHFYKTSWFMILLVGLLSIAVWQFYQYRIRHLKRQQEILHDTVQKRTSQLELQKLLLENQTSELSRQNGMLVQQNEKITRQKVQLVRMSRKVQELTVDKISFFTNISHEFRTPITLIIGPIERALKLSSNPQVIEQLHFVERNSKYLLSLINQLMDFRKVESGRLEMVKTNGNFLKFIDSLITPFNVFASERNITLNRCYRLAYPELLYDEEAIRKVIINLLSNAIKFTPNNGSITLYITSFKHANSEKEELYICVSDSGVGIPEEDLSRIFNRFYQSQNQVRYPVYGQGGTGIGLYLCKRIIQLHNGYIEARNNRNNGCSFRVRLPIQRAANKDDNTIIDIQKSSLIPEKNNTSLASVSSKLTILIVEDNPDMCAYIRSILIEHYNVVEASNGAEALELLNNIPVDFIVSDLMMPIMDGIEFSRRVKDTFAISHIPFLMLTAKSSPQTRIDSYRMGVDEYLLKPFDEELLLTRIHNILENRKRYQRKFSLAMKVDVLPMEEESSDKKFLNQVMDVIKENYRNSYFEVSDFTEAMGVSKSLLNKKFQSLIGQSCGQFIRNYRLNIAHKLILKNRKTKNMNVSEIAYEVGFNDPKYFTRCFTKHFNRTPSGLMDDAEA